MNSEEFIKKVNDRTLTVGEALTHTMSRPDANKKAIQGLINYYNNPDTSVKSSANFFEVYETRAFSETVGYPTNRFGAFGAFETVFKKSLGPTNFKPSDYKRISGPSGAADGFGLSGSQNRGKNPMRGTIYSKDLDKIYQDVLSKGSYVDANGNTIKISQDTRDFMIYEKYTGQRVDTNIGADGLKLSDLVPGVDPETGQVYVDVQSKVTKTKVRPAVRYTDEFAEFLIDKLAKAKEVAGANAKFSEIDLFKTTKSKTDHLWNNAIRPELELKFEAQLPFDKESGRGKASPKVIRKILARQLVHEFKYPADIVKSWMGHAGAGVSASGDILVENYIGIVPDDRIGLVSNNLIRNDGYNVKSGTTNTLFATRGINVKGFSVASNKSYSSYDKVHMYGPSKVDANNTANVVPLRSSEIKKIDAANSKITNQLKLESIDIEIETEKKLSNLSEAKLANVLKKKNLTLEEYKLQEEDRQNKLKLKKELINEKMPDKPENFSDGLKEVLKNLGVNVSEIAGSKTGKAVIATAATVATGVAKASPFAAGGLEYQQSRDEGKSQFESIARGAAEAVSPLPVGIREFEQVAKNVAEKTRDDASISKSGSFLNSLTGSLTGQQLNLSGGFALGGFVNRQNRR